MSRGRVMAGNLLLVAHDNAASCPGAARTARHHSLRTIGVGLVVDDERTSVFIEQRQRPLRETDPATDGSEQAPAPAADLQVDQIPGMLRVVAVRVRVAVRSRVEMTSCCRTRLAIGRLVDMDGMVARQQAAPDPAPRAGPLQRPCSHGAGSRVRFALATATRPPPPRSSRSTSGTGSCR